MTEFADTLRTSEEYLREYEPGVFDFLTDIEGTCREATNKADRIALALNALEGDGGRYPDCLWELIFPSPG